MRVIMAALEKIATRLVTGFAGVLLSIGPAAADTCTLAQCFQLTIANSSAYMIGYVVNPSGGILTSRVVSCQGRTPCVATGPFASPGPDMGEATVVGPEDEYGLSQGLTYVGVGNYGTIFNYAVLPENTYFPFTPQYGPRTGDFSIVLTAAVSNAPGQQLLVALGDVNNAPTFAAFWRDGRLEMERISPVGVLGVSAHVPWDTDMNTLNYAVPPFNKRYVVFADIMLVEFYFRFRSDGKLSVSMASVKEYDPDILVSYILDGGLGMFAGPAAASSGVAPWPGPAYRGAMGATVGRDVTQIVLVNHYMSDNEVIAFHTNGAYWRQTRAPMTAWTIGAEPCNSGNWMNIPPDRMLATVCGDRPGNGQPPKPRNPGDFEELLLD